MPQCLRERRRLKEQGRAIRSGRGKRRTRWRQANGKVRPPARWAVVKNKGDRAAATGSPWLPSRALRAQWEKGKHALQGLDAPGNERTPSGRDTDAGRLQSMVLNDGAQTYDGPSLVRPRGLILDASRKGEQAAAQRAYAHHATKTLSLSTQGTVFCTCSIRPCTRSSITVDLSVMVN